MRRLGTREIEALLPHRGTMLLCRAVEIADEGVGARSRLDLDPGGDPPAWFAEFTVPHLFVVEGLAQLSGIALGAAAEGGVRGEIGYLAEISELRFEGGLESGSEVALEVELEASFGTAHLFRVRASSGDSQLVEGVLAIAV